jgi:hypothetical protein
MAAIQKKGGTGQAAHKGLVMGCDNDSGAHGAEFGKHVQQAMRPDFLPERLWVRPLKSGRDDG